MRFSRARNSSSISVHRENANPVKGRSEAGGPYFPALGGAFQMISLSQQRQKQS
jgi:hypothetical protein